MRLFRVENIVIFSKISKYRKYEKYRYFYIFDIFDIIDIFQKMKISNKLYNNGCNTLMQLMTISYQSFVPYVNLVLRGLYYVTFAADGMRPVFVACDVVAPYPEG